MIIICDTQNTPEWHAARCGRVTASRVADIVRQTKTGFSAMRATYMAELLSERLTNTQESGYTSPDMQHGHDYEDEAARTYAFVRDATVTPVGFVRHPTIEQSGCSPDRLVGEDGLAQIKCPKTKTHIDTLLGKKIDADYLKQMQWEMACTGRVWCDFVSYDPRMPSELQLHVERVYRDQKVIDDLSSAVETFLSELSEKEGRLRALCERALEAAE